MLVVLYKNRLFSTHERKTIKEEMAHHGLGSKMCKIFRKEKSVVFAKLTTRLVTSKSISIAKKHHSNFRLVFSLFFLKKTEVKQQSLCTPKALRYAEAPTCRLLTDLDNCWLSTQQNSFVLNHNSFSLIIHNNCAFINSFQHFFSHIYKIFIVKRLFNAILL